MTKRTVKSEGTLKEPINIVSQFPAGRNISAENFDLESLKQETSTMEPQAQ